MDELKLQKVIKEVLDSADNPLFTTELSRKIAKAVIAYNDSILYRRYDCDKISHKWNLVEVR